MNHHPLEEDFPPYHAASIEEAVAEVEEKRKTYARNTHSAKVRIAVTALVSLVVSPILENITGFPFMYLGFLIAVPVIFLHLYVIKVMRADFQSSVKYGLIKKVIHSLHPNLRYSPDTFVHPVHFIEANLYPKEKITKYTGKNYIFGEVGETSVSFSEIHAERKRNAPIFNGLFFVIDFHKPFDESLYITRNTGKTPSLFLSHEPNNNEESLEHVVLENPVFQARYVVRASNQIAARYILTPSFMERIVRYSLLFT